MRKSSLRHPCDKLVVGCWILMVLSLVAMVCWVAWPQAITAVFLIVVMVALAICVQRVFAYEYADEVYFEMHGGKENEDECERNATR